MFFKASGFHWTFHSPACLVPEETKQWNAWLGQHLPNWAQNVLLGPIGGQQTGSVIDCTFLAFECFRFLEMRACSLEIQ